MVSRRSVIRRMTRSGEEHPELVLDNLVKVVRTTGGIGVVGVYMPEDPGAATEAAKEGRIGWDYGTFFTKGQRMGTGQAPVKRYNRQLRDLIIDGRARPSWIVSHELPLDDAPTAYENFDQRLDGWTKVLLHPRAVSGPKPPAVNAVSIRFGIAAARNLPRTSS